MRNESISLCLSGGGARGLAHIGIIKALEEYNVEVKAVSGASAGAIVAYLLAAGWTSEQMIQLAKKTKFYTAFKMTLSWTGLISLENLRQILNKDVKVQDFEGLKIPCYIAVTNMKSGDPEYISSGDILDAVVASCSIPLIFKPIRIGKNLYSDGGLGDNLPVKPLEQFDHKILGVNVIGKGRGKEPDSYAHMMDRTIDIIAWQNTKNSMKKCDLTISPEKTNDFGVFDFKKVDELVDVGYQKALEVFGKVPQES